jgi:hypothetical protein
MVSFACDNPDLPVGSRRTWDIFIQQTGSKRNPDSLKSQAASAQFKHNISVLHSAVSFPNLHLADFAPSAGSPQMPSLPSSLSAVVTEPKAQIENPSVEKSTTISEGASAATLPAGGSETVTAACPNPVQFSPPSTAPAKPDDAADVLAVAGQVCAPAAAAVSTAFPIRQNGEAEPSWAQVSVTNDFIRCIIRNASCALSGACCR